MVRRAMSRNITVIAALAAGALLSAKIALGAEAPVPNSYSVEVKPLPDGLTILTGGFGLGVAGEKNLNNNLSLFTEVDAVRRRVRDSIVQDLQKEMGTAYSVPQQVNATTLSIGARYYADTQADSWYGDVKTGFSASDTQWAYNGALYGDRAQTVLTTFEGGYRWLWASGFMMRFGGGVRLASIVNRDLATGDTDAQATAAKADIKQKAPTGRITVSPRLDFGFGWAF